MELEKFNYDNKIPRAFALATIIWAVIGMLVGVIIASELANPNINMGIAEITFGRLRPVHTNAVVFAFVGNGFFTAVYYSMPRLLKTEMYSKVMGWFHFWGWQAIIVLGAISLMLGYTTTKEYAELEWPLDILLTIVWLVFGANMIMTMLRRREKHLYVAIWFYLASWAAVALLHVVNSLEIPVSFMKSYSVYAGAQDALVQWWYGHNAVAFFLTTPYLGLMYYFVPKAAGRPVYSYRLSIVHFWSLIFIYMWAGPHHLLYTALPEWAQTLGTAFSIMLILPSWGGMLNGLFTLRGAWDKVRTDPILKFFVVALTCYGMATIEGPMMSLKTVSSYSHYTDWVPAHVHVGALGWNGFLTFGMLYWLIPRLYKTKLYSVKLASAHFWIGTLGILLYVVPMYWSAFKQSLMWKDFTPDGQLSYSFLETVQSVVPFYALRAVGGTTYLIGVLLMVYNLIRTVKTGMFEEKVEMEAAPLAKNYVASPKAHWHSWIERRPVQLTIFSFIVVAIGGLVEIVPTLLIKANIPTIASVKPFTPLELQGRDLYIREGCVNCHSQMIRPFRDEVARYGDYSKAGEFVYEHPFLWGSKRTGPDLAREGGKNPNSWHFNHMLDPQSTSPGSVMPPYPWLFENDLNNKTLPNKIKALRKIGVPYAEGYEQSAQKDLDKQAMKIAKDLNANKIEISEKKEIIALIAYLQRLGIDIKAENK